MEERIPERNAIIKLLDPPEKKCQENKCDDAKLERKWQVHFVVFLQEGRYEHERSDQKGSKHRCPVALPRESERGNTHQNTHAPVGKKRPAIPKILTYLYKLAHAFHARSIPREIRKFYESRFRTSSSILPMSVFCIISCSSASSLPSPAFWCSAASSCNIFVISFSARTSISKSIFCRRSAILDCLFCVIRTMMARNIASRDTMVVIRLKGKGSNGLSPSVPIFHRTHPAKKAPFRVRNATVPNQLVNTSAILSGQVLM